ncbi:toluene ABC transporter ATP-binding protein [Sorangium cellulosum]|uniref:Toluene ABC transporter ATP-binding protein n=1 Tax=Sorangium cellulosum TaxID=56 RepID=A0A4P2PZI7_SORCE|nr:ATP-binding cassette domain-containing protein [Sorangium cellulosum]AUX22337.1 toluene ABC transporter ATP-binding protein [Sorangium cellulosum]
MWRRPSSQLPQEGAAPGAKQDGGRPPGWQPGDHLFVDDVKKSFGATKVLHGITMHLRRTETAVIIGGSGAGKTTLLRLLIGLEKPTSGHIWVDGEDIGALNDYEMNRVRQKFGMVFQYAALLDSLTIFDNVAFPLREHRKHMSKRDIRDKVVGMLNSLGLENKEDRMPSELSGGQRKRVGLARALMLEPEILIYDEPTSGLDPLTSRMVDDLIEETRERYKVTSVVISHDMASTFRIAHQAFLVIQGRVVASGTPDDLAYGDNEQARGFIAAAGVAPDRISRVNRPAPSDGEGEGGTVIEFRKAAE